MNQNIWYGIIGSNYWNNRIATESLTINLQKYPNSRSARNLFDSPTTVYISTGRAYARTVLTLNRNSLRTTRCKHLHYPHGIVLPRRGTGVLPGWIAGDIEKSRR